METKNIHINRIFKMFANKEQMLLKKDIETTLKCLGFVLDKGIDIEKDAINFEEYKQIVAKLENESGDVLYTKKRILDAFKPLDPEDTGYVKASELKQILISHSEGMDQESVVDFFSVFPPNAKGEISYNVLIEKLFAKHE